MMVQYMLVQHRAGVERSDCREMASIVSQMVFRNSDEAERDSSVRVSQSERSQHICTYLAFKPPVAAIGWSTTVPIPPMA